MLNKIRPYATFEKPSITILNGQAEVSKYTVVDRKDWTHHRAIEVKLPWLRAVPAGQEWIVPLEKWMHFFLGPWLLGCQFIDIFNQMESTGEVSNVEQKKLFNGLLYKKNSFNVWYFASCLHLIGNVYKLAH